MDNVLKKMIRDELDKLDNKDKEVASNESTTSSIETSPRSGSSEKKRPKTEGRLSNLLNKIRRKTDVNEVIKKKKVQVKWKRLCPIVSTYKLVRADNGGGLRIIEAPFTTDYTFQQLKDAVIPLFFPAPENTNQYMEVDKDCHFDIMAPDGSVLDEDSKLWSYVQDHGMVVSKTTFVLTSVHLTSTSPTFHTSQTFATVCNNCKQQDYMTPFGTCLLCESMPSTSVSQSSSAFETFQNPTGSRSCASRSPISSLNESSVSNIQATTATPVATTQPVFQAPVMPDLGDIDNPIVVIAAEPVSLNFESLAAENDSVTVEKIHAGIHRGTIVKDLMKLFKTKKV